MTSAHGALRIEVMKILKRIIFPLFILLLQPPVQSQGNDTHLKFTPTKTGDFQPHMLSHIYKGCPDNSECSKEMGQKRQKWISVVSNKDIRASNHRAALAYFKKSFGLPLGFWYRPSKRLHKDIIFWQSPCQQHNSKIDPIRIAEGLFSDFMTIQDLKNKGQQVFFAKTYTEDNKGKYISYYLPRGDTPLMVKNKLLYFIREEEGHYYNMTINRKGELDIVKKFKPKEYPVEVSCPKKLLAHMIAQVKEKSLYKSYFCKAIWNKSKNKFQTFVFGWSCH